nr:large conductance mechanosensitive channel protein MscL [Streptomyces coryli]
MGGFKQFLMRGNVIDLAVAVVIGAAFTKIVNSVVEGIINPIVGLFGSQNLEQYRACFSDKCTVSDAGVVTKGVALAYGHVLSAALSFLITAAVVYFLMILPMNKYKARQAAQGEPVADEATEVELLTEIRDALVAQRGGPVGAASTPGPVGPSGPTDAAGPADPGGTRGPLDKP